MNGISISKPDAVRKTERGITPTVNPRFPRSQGPNMTETRKLKIAQERLYENARQYLRMIRKEYFSDVAAIPSADNATIILWRMMRKPEDKTKCKVLLRMLASHELGADWLAVARKDGI